MNEEYLECKIEIMRELAHQAIEEKDLSVINLFVDLITFYENKYKDIIKTPYKEELFLPIEILYEFRNSRLTKILKNNNIKYIGDLVNIGKIKLMKIKGIGKKKLSKINSSLFDRCGYYVGDFVVGWNNLECEHLSRSITKRLYPLWTKGNPYK